MYGLRRLYSRNVITSIEGYARISKNRDYENPYIVKGNIKHTSSQVKPKENTKR